MTAPTLSTSTKATGANAVESLERRLCLSAPGDLDATFGAGTGKIQTPTDGPYGDAAALAIQADGKVLAAGRIADVDVGVVRLNPDGSPDTAFGGAGGGGRIRLDLGGFGDAANELFALPGGKTLLVGTAYAAIIDAARLGRPGIALARLSPDGGLDPTFGGGEGLVVVNAAGPGHADQATAAALLPGGKVLILGRRYGYVAPYDSQLFLARFNADGTPDTGFGTGGYLVRASPGGMTANNLALLPGGDFVIVGSATDSASGRADADFALARFRPDGSPATTFGGGDGLVTTPFPRPGSPTDGDDEAMCVGATADGRIVVAGRSHVLNVGGSPTTLAAVARYRADGTLDPTFNGDGKFDPTLQEFNTIRTASDLVVTAAGDVLLAGGYGYTYAVRLGPAGNVIDQGPTPPQSPYTPPYYFDASVLAVGGGGEVFVGSNSGQGTQGVGVAKLGPDLEPDRSFNPGGPQGGGVVQTGFGPREALLDLAMADDGKIVAAGDSLAYHRIDYPIVRRYNPDGSPDLTFGPGHDGSGGGSLLSDIAGPINAVTLLPDGQILLAGVANAGGKPSWTNFLLARLTKDGLLDPTFGTGGPYLPPGKGISSTGVYGGKDEAFAVAPLPDGDILVAGRGNENDFGISRYNPDGSLHTTFGGGDGITTTNFGGDDVAYALAVLPDGRFVLAGAGNGDVAVARYLGDGRLDTTFNRTGRILTDFGGPDDVARGLAVLPDGKVLVAGRGGPAGDMFAARYAADGSLDRAFGGGDGVLTSSFGDGDGARDLVVPPDTGGRFVVAGRARAGGGLPDFALARFNADGTPDPTFAGDGVVTTDFFGAYADGANAVAADAQGGLVAGGESSDGAALARYLGGAGEEPPPPPAGVTYEAESAIVVGAAVASNHAGYGGDGFVDFLNATGDSVEWAIEVPAAGLYSLEFRYANGSSTARALQLRIDGQLALDDLPFAPTGRWSEWRVAAWAAPLAAGRHVVRLVATGQSGPNVDWLGVRLLSDVPVPPPVTTEAEDATRQGAVFSAAHRNYTGRGFVDFLNPSGDFVEFSFDAPRPGQYVLDFRYANGSAAPRATGLSVNGQTVPGGVTFAPTGSWAAWESAEVTVVLQTGVNTVRLTAAGQSGPNLDSLTVHPAVGAALTAAVVPRFSDAPIEPSGTARAVIA